MNPHDSNDIMLDYSRAYQKLYNRNPKELRAVDNDWVVVNGARMRVSELQYLTSQLQQEYQQSLAVRRGIVKRLIGWLKGS